MLRTTVMLPNDLKAKAMRYANRHGLSFGEFIRNAVESKLSGNKKEMLDPLFADISCYIEKAPKDLSLKHDEYLYVDDK